MLRLTGIPKQKYQDWPSKDKNFNRKPYHIFLSIAIDSSLFSEPKRALIISLCPPSLSPLAIRGNFLTVMIEFSWRIFYISLTENLLPQREHPSNFLSSGFYHPHIVIRNFQSTFFPCSFCHLPSARVSDRYHDCHRITRIGREDQRFFLNLNILICILT